MRTMISLMLRAPLVLALLVLSPQALTSQDKLVSLELFLDLESASNPQISPDGQEIIFTRSGVDKVNDRRYGR